MEIRDIEVIRPTCVLVLNAGGKIFYAHLADNAAAKAFTEKLRTAALSAELHAVAAGCAGRLPWKLPPAESPLAASAGDLLLCGEDGLLLVQRETTVTGAKLAGLESRAAARLSAALGGGAEVSFSLEWSE